MTEWPNLRDLEVFLAVVDKASIGAAARKLGLSQPQTSRIVASLERQLRGTLLHRSTQGSVPTALGAQCAEQSRKLLTEARHYLEWQQRAKHSEELTVTLRLGASMTIAETLVPRWLSVLRRSHPSLVVDLRVLNSQQVLRSVLDGELDLGFVETPDLPGTVTERQVGQDQLTVVVSPEHPWALRQQPISMRELAATPLVVREAGSGTRNALEEHFEGMRVAAPLQVLQSNMAVRVAAASGVAPAVLSHLAVLDQVHRGELVLVPLEESITRRLAALWQRGAKLSEEARRLVQIAADTPIPTDRP